MHIILLFVLVLLSACGGQDATPGIVGQSMVGTTQDAGIAGGGATDGGTVANGTPDGGVSVPTCKGTLTLDGVTESYDVPSNPGGGVCLWSVTDLTATFNTPSGTRVQITRIEPRQYYFGSYNGVQFRLNSQIPLIVGITPRGVTQGVPYINENYNVDETPGAKTWLSPDYGSILYKYATTAPGEPFVLDARGSVTGDQGTTFHNIVIHFETTWQ